jgi:putative FmdB family regulatory protein
MPTYEYECEQCKTRFEKKQSFHEQPIVTCPECEGKVRRVFQAAPIIFRGSGFYVTDSRPSTDIGKPSPKESTKK